MDLRQALIDAFDAECERRNWDVSNPQLADVALDVLRVQLIGGGVTTRLVEVGE